MEKFFHDPTKNRFRLGGLVLEGRLVLFHLCNRCWSLQISKQRLQNVALGLVFFLHSLHNACTGLMTHNLRFPQIDYIIGFLTNNFL